MQDCLEFIIQIYSQIIREFDISNTVGNYNMCNVRKLISKNLNQLSPKMVDHIHEIDLDFEYMLHKCENEFHNENYIILKKTFEIIESEPTKF
jgi:hypothetical protein